MSEVFRRLLVAASALLLALSFVVTGCADDPILGPEGPSDDGGGSYSVINRLAPGDSVDVAPNPEQF